MSKVTAILALGPDNVIGKGTKLAWHARKDLEWFKFITQNKPCVFGDVTFFDLPKAPLPNRLNIVCNPEFTDDIRIGTNGGYVMVNSIETAIKFASNYKEVFICGGKSIYKYCFENNLIDEVLLTLVESDDLSIAINKNPNEYVRFPFDLKKYLTNKDNWKGKEIIPEEVYPEFLFSSQAKDQKEITVKFMQYKKN